MKKAILLSILLVSCGTSEPKTLTPFKTWFCSFNGTSPSLPSNYKLKLELSSLSYDREGVFVEYLCDSETSCDTTPVATVKVSFNSNFTVDVIGLDSGSGFQPPVPPQRTKVDFNIEDYGMTLIDPTGDPSMGDLVCSEKF